MRGFIHTLPVHRAAVVPGSSVLPTGQLTYISLLPFEQLSLLCPWWRRREAADSAFGGAAPYAGIPGKGNRDAHCQGQVLG